MYGRCCSQSCTNRKLRNENEFSLLKVLGIGNSMVLISTKEGRIEHVKIEGDRASSPFAQVFVPTLNGK